MNGQQEDIHTHMQSLRQIIFKDNGAKDSSSEVLKNKEMAIQKASSLLREGKSVSELVSFVRGLQVVWKDMPRAKTAKLIKGLLDDLEGVADGLAGEARTKAKEEGMKLVKELVAWSVEEKRTFLQQNLELRLASLYVDNRMYTEAIGLVGQLLCDLKRMDDKLTLVEVHLLECKIYFQLRNGAKAKASLTAARSNANSVYCPPILQAALDTQSAMVHADDGDFKTAYSYFMEALDGWASQEDARGARALKYMMLCKIMQGGDHYEEIDGLVGSKLGQKYAMGAEVTAMKAVGGAYKEKSLAKFEAALAKFPEQLGTDPMIHSHFQTLYDQLLQQNLLRIIEPYTKVQLEHIATKIGLPVTVVETKLCMMVLDGQLKAIIDQNEQCLVILNEAAGDAVFELGLSTLKYFDSIVESLYQKAA